MARACPASPEAPSAPPLLRTWTVRGTVHLIAASDRPWLHALFATRNARVFGARFERFGIVEEVNAMRGDVAQLCGERPRDRPSLLRALIERGHPSLEQGPINTFVPWLSTRPAPAPALAREIADIERFLSS